MLRTDLVEEIGFLTKQNHLYYNEGDSEVSDAEFDRRKDNAVEELQKIDPNNVWLTNIGSPINDESPWENIKHEYPLGSLSKIKTPEELNKWYKGKYGNKLIVQEKLDGISISLTYENGKLVEGSTRGNGCLDYNTIVEFDNGDTLPIGYVVENNIRGNIKTYNHNLDIVEYKPIIDWLIQNNDYDWIEIEIDKNLKIVLTENHEIWSCTKSKYISAKDIDIGDEIKLDQ